MRNLMLLTILVAGCGDDGTTDQCPEEAPVYGSGCNFHRPGAHLCYYYDECTKDPSGLIASCNDGKWWLGANLPFLGCPQTPPADGAACPCGFLGRQLTPCNYRCAGGNVHAECEPPTLEWSTTGTIDSTCTRIVPDGGVF